MYKVKLTAVKIANYTDLQKLYENPIEHTCSIIEGQSFISENASIPQGFCDEAWKIVYPFVKDLAEGKGDFFDGWMKNKFSAMISCNDGFRPVSFLIERIEK